MSRLAFVKLGGSVITDKNREATAQPEVIRRLAREIARARAADPLLRLVVGHGSGSFGHFAGRHYGTHLGLRDDSGWEGYAQTGAAAARLNRLVTDLFLEEGLPAVSLQPSASAWCRRAELAYLDVRPVRTLLEADVVPLVYGDVALDETQGFAIVSTETIFAYLAGQLRPDRVILAGIVDGVYTADPMRDPEAALIPEISPANMAEVEGLLGGSHGVDVTGGMLSKVREMYALARAHSGLRVQIISGLIPGRLEEALVRPTANMGTVLHA